MLVLWHEVSLMSQHVNWNVSFGLGARGEWISC